MPESATDCGLPLPESVKVSVAERVPDAVGLNSTLAVHEAEAARLVLQVLLARMKSPALVPERATLFTEIEALVPLLKVAVCVPVVEPTATAPKERLDGVAVTLPPPLLVPVPVPESATACGLPDPVSVKWRLAVRVPAAVGANRTSTVQLPEAARLLPQVFE